MEGRDSVRMGTGLKELWVRSKASVLGPLLLTVHLLFLLAQWFFTTENRLGSYQNKPNHCDCIVGLGWPQAQYF